MRIDIIFGAATIIRFMKTRTYQVLNFIAINLLLLALYLNFIHKDNNTAPSIPTQGTVHQRTASSPGADQHTTHSEEKTSVLN